MLASGDPFSPALREAFHFNYDPNITHQPPRNEPVLPPDSPPFTFYDRHIACNLVLKQLVYLPSLSHSLSKLCENTIEKFTSDGNKFYQQGFRIYPGNPDFKHAGSVRDYYIANAGSLGHSFASIALLHPACPSWASLLMLHDPMTRRHESPPFLTEASLQVRGYPEDGDLNFSEEYDKDLMEGLDQATQDRVLDIGRRFPRLASWEMFAMTDVAISMFRKVHTETAFIWERCHTIGSQTTVYSAPPPDATQIVSQFIPSLKVKRLKSFATRSYSTPKFVTKTSKEVIPLKPPSRPRQYRPEFRYHLQHAWAKAVVNDSTFMTLNCGRYERIGIRHRASQTLYLSALIDPVNIQDPHYGKLHIGLHMAIVQDVLERYELAISSEKNTSTKRPAGDAEIPPSKRRKGSDNSIPVDTDNQTEKHRETIANETGARMVALVNLQYGPYCSPAPASFVRLRPSCAPSLQPKPPSVGKRKAKYGAHEFFTLTLGEQRFRGATGVVHPASLELRVVLPSGEIQMSTLKRDGLIVKSAFLPDQQKRLHHEFDISLHLAQRGAKGVVVVHGLFSDPESGALALVMDDGGKSLRQRERERTGEVFPLQVTTTDEERKAFLEIIDSIHKAGVRHRDITADNLVVDCNTGQAFIIDFDQAEIARPRTNYRVEVQCLEYLLEGQYMRMTYELYN